jgi:hypothetical protein
MTRSPWYFLLESGILTSCFHPYEPFVRKP